MYTCTLACPVFTLRGDAIVNGATPTPIESVGVSIFLFAGFSGTRFMFRSSLKLKQPVPRTGTGEGMLVEK